MLLQESKLLKDPTKKYHLYIGNTERAVLYAGDCDEDDLLDITEVDSEKEIKAYLDANLKPYEVLRYGCKVEDVIYVYMFRYGTGLVDAYQYDEEEGWVN